MGGLTCQSVFEGYNRGGGSDEMETGHNFEFDSGRLCLDFSNTLGDRPVEAPREEDLHRYADLVDWSEAAGIVSTDEAAAMQREALRLPAEAEATFARAIALREAIYRLFSALAAGEESPVDDLAAVNRAIGAAAVQGRLAPLHGHFRWQWEHDPAVLDTMLAPVAWSVAE